MPISPASFNANITKEKEAGNTWNEKKYKILNERKCVLAISLFLLKKKIR
jgi:hypothetical protein